MIFFIFTFYLNCRNVGTENEPRESTGLICTAVRVKNARRFCRLDLFKLVTYAWVEQFTEAIHHDVIKHVNDPVNTDY